MKMVMVDECVDRKLLYHILKRYYVILPERGSSDIDNVSLAAGLDIPLVTCDKGIEYDKVVYVKSRKDLKRLGIYL